MLWNISIMSWECKKVFFTVWLYCNYILHTRMDVSIVTENNFTHYVLLKLKEQRWYTRQSAILQECYTFYFVIAITHCLFSVSINIFYFYLIYEVLFNYIIYCWLLTRFYLCFPLIYWNHFPYPVSSLPNLEIY